MNQTPEKSLWEQQKDGQWKTLTNPLAQDPEIHAKIDDLITTFYWNFRQKKGITKGTYNPEINFQGFSGFEDYLEEESKMGYCKSEIGISEEWQTINGKKVAGSETKTYQGTMSISLSQKLLLDKLGMDKHFINESHFFSVGFEQLIGTMAHELAHAYQNTIRIDNGEEVKSQCESSGDKNKYPELVAEHTALTEEIEQMIKSSTEYQEFKSWWNKTNEPNSEPAHSHTQKSNQEVDPNSSSSLSDKVKDKTNQVGDASSKTIKKTGEKVKSLGEGWENKADKPWARWVLPVGIVLGVLLLVGIIAGIFRARDK